MGYINHTINTIVESTKSSLKALSTNEKKRVLSDIIGCLSNSLREIKDEDRKFTVQKRSCHGDFYELTLRTYTVQEPTFGINDIVSLRRMLNE